MKLAVLLRKRDAFVRMRIEGADSTDFGLLKLLNDIKDEKLCASLEFRLHMLSDYSVFRIDDVAMTGPGRSLLHHNLYSPTK